ncbi:ABC transporter permease, partial [Parabacteroides sp. OttesenSCG-928-J18]|nr:ABC transporter permease [Parabacteroides sp. OttesenSCG-928-J18]
MILPHYIKVAWRNLLRYKTQSIISIVGLAVGFACFVLASIWIRYELTYDTFHQDTERIYMVRKLSEHSPGGLSQYTTFPLAEYLENNLPEVELAANCQYGLDKYQLGNSLQDTYTLGAGKKFLQMFPIQIVEGTEDFLIDKADNIAITERIAKKIYGKESPIGKTLNVSREEKTIVAVVKNWPMHSNFSFDMVSPVWSESSWGYTSWHTFIKLHEGVDVEAFRQKLEELVIHPGDNSVYKGLKMTPISKIRYENPFKETALHFNHLIWFAIAGGLLVLCALFNYLNLFVTRMRIRSRELGLRKVCGSSNRHLLWLFSVEFLFTLFWAILLGLTLLELILPFFKEISEINTSRLSIYLEAIGYSAVIALLSFLVSLLPIYYFRRHSLHQMVKGGKKGGDRRGFQQAGILCQLVISIGIIFCSVVLIKQVHHLRTAEMGIARENRAVVRTSPPVAELKDLLAQIPTITEIYGGMEEPLVPSFGSAHLSINQWEGRQEGASDVTLRQIDCSHAYFDYYGFKLIAGSMPEDGEEKKVLINESAAKALGMDDPVGKSIMSESGPVITGVVQDFFISSPTEPIQPMLFHFRKKDYGGQIILLKYSEGKWKECKQ